MSEANNLEIQGGQNVQRLLQQPGIPTIFIGKHLHPIQMNDGIAQKEHSGRQVSRFARRTPRGVRWLLTFEKGLPRP